MKFLARILLAGAAASFCAACDNQVLVDAENLNSQTALLGLDANIVKPGDVVKVNGANLSKDLAVRVDGLDGNLEVLSDTEAQLTVPEGIRSGKIDVIFTKGESNLRTYSVFSSRLGIASPMSNLPPEKVCSDISYLNTEGESITGTRNCEGTSSESAAYTACTTAGQVNCLVQGYFRAAPACEEGSSNCFLPSYNASTQPLIAFDLSSLTPGVIKSGTTIAGVTGAYPSTSFPLSGSDSTSDLTTGNFQSLLSQSALFAWFDRSGNRYTRSGSPDLDATNILSGKTILGFNGTVVLPDAWDVRVGSTFGSSSTGKLKVNCRNGANLSAINLGFPYPASYDGSANTITVPGLSLSDNTSIRISQDGGGMPFNDRTVYYVRQLSGNTFKISTTSGGNVYEDFNGSASNIYVNLNSGATADPWDNTMPVTTLSQNPWSDSDNLCGGLESSSGDSSVWKNMSSGGSSCTECRYKDKISGLEWSKVISSAVYSKAVNACADLVFDSQSDWRLPSYFELTQAAAHGIGTVTNSNWITSSQFNEHFISSTTRATDDVAALSVNLATGERDVPWKNTIAKNVVCVRP